MSDKELTESRKREEEIRTCVRSGLLWVFWEKSGARFIWHKFQPEDEKEIAKILNYKKPSTFFLWAIGVYMALYGLTSTKYELALDRAESRMSTVVAQLSTTNDEAFRNLIAQIPEIQKIKTSIKPGIFNPVSVVLSLFVEKVNPDIIDRSKKVLVVWKKKLTKVDLSCADLTGANLVKANLTNANLQGADLTNATLWYATLTNADLRNANLTNTNIGRVNNAPKGFEEWASTQGAVGMSYDEWPVTDAAKVNKHGDSEYKSDSKVVPFTLRWLSR